MNGMEFATKGEQNIQLFEDNKIINLYLNKLNQNILKTPSVVIPSSAQ